MSQALIASVARSPIGRAVKGSLVDVRPDDLAAKMVEAAIGAVPQLDPTEIEDLYLGCGEPYDEQGANMARRVAVLAGLDGLPGATINRFCSSSLQTTRMAMHAIRAGEGDVFISAGVECGTVTAGNSCPLNGLRACGGRYGLQTMCVGGGQGMAMIPELLA
jgi:acetyl-CoA C-acetyltransferase